MIIQNGYIETKEKQSNGIDPETGYPIPDSQHTWSKPIPCQYAANRYDHLGTVNGGHFTIAEYIIYIEEQPFTAEQIRLTDMHGNGLGEYSIRKVEPLEAVCQLKITV